MFKKITRDLLNIIVVVILTLGASISFQSLSAAWQGPSAIPPGGNASGAINIGSIGQSKVGGLILNTGGSANGLIVYSGNVGIGNASPSTKLDVNGGLKIGNETSCVNGVIRWTGDDFEGCKGGSWVSFTSGGTTPTATSNYKYWRVAVTGASGGDGAPYITEAQFIQEGNVLSPAAVVAVSGVSQSNANLLFNGDTSITAVSSSFVATWQFSDGVRPSGIHFWLTPGVAQRTYTGVKIERSENNATWETVIDGVTTGIAPAGSYAWASIAQNIGIAPASIDFVYWRVELTGISGGSDPYTYATEVDLLQSGSVVSRSYASIWGEGPLLSHATSLSDSITDTISSSDYVSKNNQAINWKFSASKAPNELRIWHISGVTARSYNVAVKRSSDGLYWTTMTTGTISSGSPGASLTWY